MEPVKVKGAGSIGGGSVVLDDLRTPAGALIGVPQVGDTEVVVGGVGPPGDAAPYLRGLAALDTD